MSYAFPSRYDTAAQAALPDDSIFNKFSHEALALLIEEANAHAFRTVIEGKGGPFGAQLWAVNKKTGEMVLFGSKDKMQDSNAVRSKGIASAHAEAESLSEENRNRAKIFLSFNQTEDMDWEMLQISSAESCPSCRAKQIQFAEELRMDGLIGKTGFNVLFKGSYEQTQQVPKFNDLPFDTTFRLINRMRAEGKINSLLDLDAAIKADEELAAMADPNNPQIIYNPVSEVSSAELSDDINDVLKIIGDQPFAVLVNDKGEILSFAVDEREYPGQFENGAIVRVLQNASRHRRVVEGEERSWDLQGAKLITNIRDIGPGAYAETLWSSLSGIEVVKEYASDEIDEQAAEIASMTNAKAFEFVGAEYNAPLASIQVMNCEFIKGQMPKEGQQHDGVTNPEFILWDALMKRDELLRRQQQRLTEFGNVGFRLFDGQRYYDMTFNEFVQANAANNNYDAKAAPTPAVA